MIIQDLFSSYGLITPKFMKTLKTISILFYIFIVLYISSTSAAPGAEILLKIEISC